MVQAQPSPEAEKEIPKGLPPTEKPSVPKPPPEPKIPEVSPQTAKAPLIIQYGPTIRSFKQLPITIGKGQTLNIP